MSLKSIDILLEDNGVMSVSQKSGTVICLMIPRSLCKLQELEKIELFESKLGVYILVGEDELDETQIYIGEATNLHKRLDKHFRDAEKDFFSNVLVFIFKDKSVSTTHIKYLEKMMIELSKKCCLNTENKNIPQITTDVSTITVCENFMKDICLFVKVLRFNFFTPYSVNKNNNTTFWKIDKDEVKAEMAEYHGKYVVLEGSIIHPIVRKDAKLGKKPAVKKRKGIIESFIKVGILEAVENDYFKLKRDIPFDTPSAAAGFVIGFRSNGLQEWKHDGKSMKDI